MMIKLDTSMFVKTLSAESVKYEWLSASSAVNRSAELNASKSSMRWIAKDIHQSKSLAISIYEYSYRETWIISQSVIMWPLIQLARSPKWLVHFQIWPRSLLCCVENETMRRPSAQSSTESKPVWIGTKLSMPNGWKAWLAAWASEWNCIARSQFQRLNHCTLHHLVTRS